jgi:hypothetical protein
MGTIEAINAISATPAPKRRQLPKHVHAEKNRHGTVCYYFREDRKSPRIRLRSKPGSAEFLNEYDPRHHRAPPPPQAASEDIAGPPASPVQLGADAQELGRWREPRAPGQQHRADNPSDRELTATRRIARLMEMMMGKPILCLDFDGVLHSYSSGWKGADVIPTRRRRAR